MHIDDLKELANGGAREGDTVSTILARHTDLGRLLGDTTPVHEAALLELGFAQHDYDGVYHLDPEANNGDGRGVFSLLGCSLHMQSFGTFQNVRSMGQLRCLLLGVDA